MPNTFPAAGRLLDDDEFPSPNGEVNSGSRHWTRVAMSQQMPPQDAMRRLSAPRQDPPPLRTAQRACYEALGLALKEGHVFAALTGPEGSGKTTVLEAVIADRRDRALRCIRISEPDKVPAALAAQIEQVAYAEAGKPENLDRHVVLAVDDAHTASDELLRCLARLAAMREPGRRVPQVMLVGRPELWNRLNAEEYEPLARRLAIRAVLPTAEEDTDPWAFVEEEVTRTMSHLRDGAELMPASPAESLGGRGGLPEFGHAYAYGSSDSVTAPMHDDAVPPPSMYALFPDPPPRHETRSPARESRRRLLLPIAGLFVGVTAFALVLSFYDWPDMFGDLPWSTPKPSTPFMLPNLPQNPDHGLPQPTWGVPAQHASATPAPQSVPAQPAIVPPPAAPTGSASPTVAAAPAPHPSAAEPPVSAPPKPAPVEAHRPPPTPAPVAVAEIAPAPTAEPAPSPAASPSPQTSTPAPPVAPISVTQAPSPSVTANSPPQPTPAPAAPPPSVTAAARVSPPIPAAPVQPATAQPARPAALAASQAPLPPAIISLLLRRGDEEASIGDLSAARSFYERAAEGGSAAAARQVARTYDAVFLPPTDSVMADPAVARRWYERAASLGDKEAAFRLKALNEGR